MSRYDGLIIPRSYNEYINKTDPVAMSQALQLNGVMDDAPTADSNKPVKSGGVVTALEQLTSLPTDAVLHYSFDEVPDYPDGTALYKKNNDWTNDDLNSWSGNATKSILNSRLKISGSSGQNLYKLTNTYSTGSIIIIKGIARLDAVIEIKNTQNSSDTTLVRVNVYANKNFEFYIPTQGRNIIFRGVSTTWDIEISGIYIGDGSYSTPVIDNANGQNNATNNGGLAVQGISGKGAYFLTGKYATIGNFNLTPNFTVSLWINTENNTNGFYEDIFSKSSQIILRNGASWGNYFMLYLYGKNSPLLNGVNINGSLLPPNKWNHIVVSRNALTCNVYINGEKIRTYTLSDGTINNNNNSFRVGGDVNSPNTRLHSLDDFLIFDRGLTDNEVMALYLNRGNTPKYYSWADWKLQNTQS